MPDLRLADDTILAAVALAPGPERPGSGEPGAPLALPAFEQAVLARIDGVTSNRDVGRLLGLAPSDLQVALTALLACHAVEVRSEARTLASPPRTDAPAARTEVSKPSSPSSSSSSSSSSSTTPAPLRPSKAASGSARERLVLALEEGKPAAARLAAQEAGVRGAEWESLVENNLGLSLAMRERRAFVRRYVSEEPRSPGAWSLLATLLDDVDAASAANAARKAADLAPSSKALAERARIREARAPKRGGLFGAFFGPKR